MRGSLDISVDLDDVIMGMSDKDKQEFADELWKEGVIAKKDKSELPKSDFDEQVMKLIGNNHKLSSEDEQTILIITNKIVL